jgi:hypothetical protein
MPTPERLGPYADRLLIAARAFVADPENMAKRTAYMRATFNLDWTAAAIVTLADREPEQ